MSGRYVLLPESLRQLLGRVVNAASAERMRDREVLEGECDFLGAAGDVVDEVVDGVVESFALGFLLEPVDLAQYVLIVGAGQVVRSPGRGEGAGHDVLLR